VSAAVALFPGQGSPPRDMRERVETHLPDLAALLYDEVGHDVFDAPEGSQRRLQAALFGSIMSGWRRIERLLEAGVPVWGEPGAAPLAFGGHSLGEIPALVVAGSLDLETAVHFVHVRGTIMEEALAGPAQGAMASLIGPEARSFVEREVSGREDVWLCADNSSVQVMVSGREDAVAAVRADAAAAGLRVVPMHMRGAGHSPLMAPCLGPYRQALEAVTFREPSVPVYSCATAKPFVDPARELADGVIAPVRFRELVIALHERGARRFVDVGPGHTLAGLAHKTLGEGVETPAVVDLESEAGASVAGG
jgi:acyl transferase domain-containing protein